MILIDLSGLRELSQKIFLAKSFLVAGGHVFEGDHILGNFIWPNDSHEGNALVGGILELFTDFVSIGVEKGVNSTLA